MAHGKILPHSLEAEQAVLACVMLDYVGCSDGFDKITESDFYAPVHKTIFTAMRALLEKKDKTIDFVTVAEQLTKSGKLESIGGLAYLNIVNDAVPSVANFRHYLDILKKNRVLRKLNSAGVAIIESSYGSDDEQAALGAAEKAIFDISRDDEKKELTAISQELPAVLDRLDTIQKDPTSVRGLRTGIYGIDNLTNGLHKGELIILAARPGIGKTSLGLNMILNAAVKSGKKCALFSLEMSKSQLTTRALCSLAMVNMYKANKGELSPEEWQRLWHANEELSRAGLYIDDNSDITPMEIKRKCMRLKRESGLDFVMVDYLGLMDSGLRNRENRQVEVAANSRAMKILSKDLDIPVLLIAQLNRSIETRNRKGEDARPALHDLRESGAIEQDADIVMFIHMNKPSEQNEEEQEDSKEADIILAKHRNGPQGSVKVRWNKEWTTFSNLPAEQAAQEARDRASRKQTADGRKQTAATPKQKPEALPMI